MMKTIALSCTAAALLTALLPQSAWAWAHAGRYGGEASGGGGSWQAHSAWGGSAAGGGGSWSARGRDDGSASGGSGSWNAESNRGGTAQGGSGSWNAKGAEGGSAQGGSGSWTASSHYGTTAYHNDNYYGGSYSTYHPPTTVNYYNNSCGGCGGWGAAGAAAAGVAVGESVVAGQARAADANAYAQGYAASGGANAAYSIGAIYPTLPAGCVTPNVGGTAYELCGNNWYKPAYGANGVYYRAVPAP
jgi:hypothetical protein